MSALSDAVNALREAVEEIEGDDDDDFGSDRSWDEEHDALVLLLDLARGVIESWDQS